MKNEEAGIYFYSASRNAFFPDVLREDFEDAGTWPVDAVEISDDVYTEFGRLSAPEGKIMGPGDDGLPEWLDVQIDYQAKAESARQRLISEANTITADWLVDLQLGVIDDDDKASLIKWRTYSKALNAMDLSAVADEESFNAIEWTDRPTSAQAALKR